MKKSNKPTNTKEQGIKLKNEINKKDKLIRVMQKFIKEYTKLKNAK